MLWFGASEAFYSYDEKRDKWTDYTDLSGAPYPIEGIHGIAQDKNGDIWICYSSYPESFAVLRAGHWRRAVGLTPVNTESLGRILIAGNRRSGRTPGTIWFLSPEGLIAYDGSGWTRPLNPAESTIKIYRDLKYNHRTEADLFMEKALQDIRRANGEKDPPPNPWSSGVQCGVQDQEGDIWLGAVNGIWRLQPRTGHWRIYTTQVFPATVDRAFADRYGRVWFADWTGHLAVYDKHKDALTSYDLSPRLQGHNALIQTVYVDKRSNVIIGTDLGSFVLDESTNNIRPLEFSIAGAPVQSISAITEDDEGRIWMGTSEGILVLKQ
jgi:ligand-binding sensor domain-containing protein